jgi:threonylcarbamoyladenosine tRNA methylthiotransferase MtaB
MRKFKITTLGCKVNQYESEAIARDLQNAKWAPAPKHEQADLCIINTCTVTQKASMQSRQAVHRAIRTNPGARIVVTGCYAQTHSAEIEKISGVNYIIGHGEKHHLAGHILMQPARAASRPISICTDISRENRFKPASGVVYGLRSRPFLKIQDGCDSFCTYCIVPFARGPSRSMNPADVLENMRQLSQAGYHEVVLTGVHVGNYGLDLSPKTDLLDLLHRIHESNPIHRVRLSSIEPLELTDDIIRRMAESPNFCRHFHVPLQSGDDRILKQMQRPYSAGFFRERVIKIQELLPDAAVGVDILIGFPGETEAAFENTYKIIEELPVAYLHVFPFSSRPGTPASKFSGRVPSKIIKKRSERMRNLGVEKKKRFFKRFLGQRLEVLVEEKRDTKTGWIKTLSSNYIPVLIEAADDQENKITHVRLEKLDSSGLPLGIQCAS